MTRIMQELLTVRGVGREFLQVKYEDIFNPFLLPDMKDLAERVFLAAQRREKVVIYGDYDVDGVTAATVMEAALLKAGCEVAGILLPDRFRDGYGMSKGMVDEVIKLGASLVVTVDCGSGNAEIIQELKKHQIDTIVSDHHVIGDEGQMLALRESGELAAFLNPQRQDCKYGKKMAGVGVAFQVARAINALSAAGYQAGDAIDDYVQTQQNIKCDGQEKWLLDLVALGTVADAMELRDENRIIVKYGTLVLAKTRRTGLQELMRVANVNNSKISTRTIAFQLAPRLNAGGRMQSAYRSLELLRAKARPEAFHMATKLENLNKERRKMQDMAMAEIEVMGVGDEAVIVVQGAWHEGVIGIIAGHLVEKYRRPSFVFAVAGETLKGSARSFGDFSLAQALAACQDSLVKGGGHAMAAGATLMPDKFEDFKAQINDYYRSLNLKNQERFLEVRADLKLDDFSELNLELTEEIAKLEPFGEGNLEPVFEVEAEVASNRVLKEKHLALVLKDGQGRYMKMMAFFAPDAWMSLRANQMLRVRFSLEENEFRGERKVEGRIKAISVEN